MDKKEKEPKKPPKPATEAYKILQELKAIHDTLKKIFEEMR